MPQPQASKQLIQRNKDLDYINSQPEERRQALTDMLNKQGTRSSKMEDEKHSKMSSHEALVDDPNNDYIRELNSDYRTANANQMSDWDKLQAFRDRQNALVDSYNQNLSRSYATGANTNALERQVSAQGFAPTPYGNLTTMVSKEPIVRKPDLIHYLSPLASRELTNTESESNEYKYSNHESQRNPGSGDRLTKDNFKISTFITGKHKPLTGKDVGNEAVESMMNGVISTSGTTDDAVYYYTDMNGGKGDISRGDIARLAQNNLTDNGMTGFANTNNLRGAFNKIGANLINDKNGYSQAKTDKMQKYLSDTIFDIQFDDASKTYQLLISPGKANYNGSGNSDKQKIVKDSYSKLLKLMQNEGGFKQAMAEFGGNSSAEVTKGLKNASQDYLDMLGYQYLIALTRYGGRYVQ